MIIYDDQTYFDFIYRDDQMEIISQYCIGCGYCYIVCPEEAISRDSEMRMKISHRCIECGNCKKYCPMGAIIETRV